MLSPKLKSLIKISIMQIPKSYAFYLAYLAGKKVIGKSKDTHLSSILVSITINTLGVFITGVSLILLKVIYGLASSMADAKNLTEFKSNLYNKLLNGQIMSQGIEHFKFYCCGGEYIFNPKIEDLLKKLIEVAGRTDAHYILRRAIHSIEEASQLGFKEQGGKKHLTVETQIKYSENKTMGKVVSNATTKPRIYMGEKGTYETKYKLDTYKPITYLVEPHLDITSKELKPLHEAVFKENDKANLNNLAHGLMKTGNASTILTTYAKGLHAGTRKGLEPAEKFTKTSLLLKLSELKAKNKTESMLLIEEAESLLTNKVGRFQSQNLTIYLTFLGCRNYEQTLKVIEGGKIRDERGLGWQSINTEDLGELHEQLNG